jgi:hypothetical protein
LEDPSGRFVYQAKVKLREKRENRGQSPDGDPRGSTGERPGREAALKNCPSSLGLARPSLTDDFPLKIGTELAVKGSAIVSFFGLPPKPHTEGSLAFELRETGFVDPSSTALALEELKARGLIRERNGRIRLAPGALKLSSEVRGRFSFPELGHLMVLQKKLADISFGRLDRGECLSLLTSEIELTESELRRYRLCRAPKNRPSENFKLSLALSHPKGQRAKGC